MFFLLKFRNIFKVVLLTTDMKKGKKISNRWLYTLISFGIVLITAGVVYAAAPNPGHTSSDISFEGDIDLGINNLYFSSSDPGDIVFATSSQVEQARIYSLSDNLYLRANDGGYHLSLYDDGDASLAGNLAVGSTSNPSSYRLDVSGTTRLNGNVAITGSSSMGDDVHVTDGDNQVEICGVNWASGGCTGTTGISHIVDDDGSYDALMLVGNDVSGDRRVQVWDDLQVKDQASVKTCLRIDGSEGTCTSSEGLVVDGNVGIGVTSPASRLSIGGSGSSSHALYVDAPGAGASSTAIFASGSNVGVQASGTTYGLYGSATNNYGVYGSGPTGVYGVSTTGVAVQGYGQTYDFYASGPGTNYGQSSSIRWKEDVREIPNALDMIEGMRGVYFNWDEEHGGEHDIGFIAEEVGVYVPEIVNYEEDGIFADGMDYSGITPVLLQAIKELKAEKDALEERIEALEARC